MYAIHTTPGLVIDSRPYGEAGKILSIFTRDLGLVAVTAAGIRYEKSKLRYYVQNNSFSTFSLVRGKEFWRLTSAAAENGSTEAASSSQELIAKLSAVLKRLLQGEEPHPELYELIRTCGAFLQNNPDLTDEQMRSLESLTVLRILHTLGYVGKDPQFAAHLASADLDAALLDAVAPLRSTANKHINTALKESHL